MIFTLPAVLMIFTNPLTAFGDAGTLAAFGFLVAYYLITVAAPMYLKKIGELTRRNVVLACIAVLCLLVPTIGSFYPQPPWPVNVFPYIYLAWMAIGGGWLLVVNRRQPGILADIEVDLERAPELTEGDSIEIPERSPQPVMA
jgi:amino acid transporter